MQNVPTPRIALLEPVYREYQSGFSGPYKSNMAATSSFTQAVTTQDLGMLALAV